MGNLTIICGVPGQGKTHFVKSAIKGVKNLVYDPNREYAGFTTFYGSPAEFIAHVSQGYDKGIPKITGTSIVFEEATTFLRGKIPQPVASIIGRRRHYNNNLYFNFMTLNRVPPELYEIANFIVLFHTGDTLETIMQKFGKDANVVEAFNEQRKMPFIKRNVIFNGSQKTYYQKEPLIFKPY